MLHIVASYHCMQFQGKLMNQTSFGLDFGSFGPYWAARLFFKNLASPVTRCHGQLSSCTISKKSNDPIFRKLSDGGTDGQTDQQTHRLIRVISLDAARLTFSVK